MNARKKLNQYHTHIALGVAAILGLATESMLVFVGMLALLIGLNLHSGDIRLKREQGPSHRTRNKKRR